MEQFAAEHTWANDGRVADIAMLAMFCMAMRRDTFEKLGPLDEQFGIGLFEDDDYSQRAKQAGYRVVCAGDVFVHHFGQMAFKDLEATGEYARLFAENQRRYEQKWNLTWEKHHHAELAFVQRRDQSGGLGRPPLKAQGSHPSAETPGTGKAAENPDYAGKLAKESGKWGSHLQLEAGNEWHAWLCHPLVLENYQRRSLVDGLAWPLWVRKVLDGPVRRSLDLGCGSGGTSLKLHSMGAAQSIEGIDVSGERVAQAEKHRIAAGIDGGFRVGDANRLRLPANTYDLIVSSHSFHHFVELERIMEQVHEALTPDGFFILEEFVGPTQFQWTDLQMQMVKERLAIIPERLRIFRWGALKSEEGRPTPAEVEAESPFESIRSGEIVPLFHKYFDVVGIRKLGGTLQHLLFNGIAHQFLLADDEAVRQVKDICAFENNLIDEDVIPSDFMLLIGRRRGAGKNPHAENPRV